ncbi:MAG: hypothetical protein PHP42_14030 [Bacteroidota bacterium]|nr:hypothetical protein [Bacteroidota bacterium]
MFKTRSPENPVSENQTAPLATTPDQLITNFTNAFQQKNIQEYVKLFADTATHARQFTFIPNQSAAARYIAVFSSWTTTSEHDYFLNAMTAVGTSTPQLELTYPTPPVQYQSDSALYTISYSIFVPHKRTNVTTQFTGRSELYVSPNKNNIWMIYRWVDFETKKDSSWSELKGQFAK